MIGRPWFMVRALAFMPLLLWATAAAQIQGNASHILFGDLKVTNQSDSRLPGSFRILLKNVAGQILRRQSISAGGRFRFLEVPNGDYILAVECNGVEQVQIPMLINEFKSTDLRRDLELAWHSREKEDSSSPKLPAATISTLYVRSEANQALFEKAQADIEGNSLRAARSKLKEVVADDPEDFEAWTELGNVHFRSEEWADARASYQEALGQMPNYLPALFNLGKLAMVREDYDQAIDLLSQATRLDGGLAQAFYLLGEACLQVKKGSAAVEHFRRALELEPLQMADAHLRMAALYSAANYPQLAIREYEDFLRKRPDSELRETIEKLIAKNKTP